METKKNFNKNKSKHVKIAHLKQRSLTIVIWWKSGKKKNFGSILEEIKNSTVTYQKPESVDLCNKEGIKEITIKLKELIMLTIL